VIDHRPEEAADAIAFAREWLRTNPPGLTGSLREAQRALVLAALRDAVAEVSQQEQLLYVTPVDAKTQKHLRRVPGVGK
jgi:hypothetical protein